MTTAVIDPAWSAAGGRAVDAIAPHAAVVVQGANLAATAAVALGIAKAVAVTRPVYLLDLLGDGSPFAPVTSPANALGVHDVIAFGVSLERAALPHAELAGLYLVGGGTGDPTDAEVLADRRWGVLVEWARRAGHLLLLALPGTVTTLAALETVADGLVVVGPMRAPEGGLDVLARVTNPRSAAPPSEEIRALVPGGRPASRAARRPIGRAMALWVIAASALAVPVVHRDRWLPRAQRLFDLWMAAPERPLLDAGRAVLGLPTGTALPFTVELLATASPAVAEALATRPDGADEVTVSAVRRAGDSVPVYRVTRGAFADSAAADAYLSGLRDAGTLAPGGGRVTRTPYALRLASVPSARVAADIVREYRGRGILAYAVDAGPDGWRVYVGAFASQQDASSLAGDLTRQSIQAALEPRAGSAP